MVVLEYNKDLTQEELILQLYEEVFPKACAYLHKRGGSLEHAKEVFQEALLVYYEKCHVEGFAPERDDKAYLFGIVKNLWSKHHQVVGKTASVDQLQLVENEEPMPQIQKVLNLVKRSGEKCLELLQTFYYERLSMQEVAQKFGYKTERSATVQKYKCLEKIRNEVKQKALNYEDFLD